MNDLLPLNLTRPRQTADLDNFDGQVPGPADLTTGEVDLVDHFGAEHVHANRHQDDAAD
jgi:hypothetical protein